MNDYDPFHSGNQEWVELDIEVQYMSDLAIKLQLDDLGDEDIWIPLSQTKIDGNPATRDDFLPGRSYTIEVPEWLAEEKGLV